jgi:hypothetical protein
VGRHGWAWGIVEGLTDKETSLPGS